MNNIHNYPYKSRILDLKISNLLAFVTVAETGSFSKAGLQLYLTQPTISRRIADLENLLDCKLFDRIRNKVIMTEAARQLLPKAQQILHTIQESTQLIQQLSGNISGEIRLGVSGYIAESFLRPIMQDFTNLHPGVELNIELFGNSKKAQLLLEAGELDLVITTLPTSPQDNHQVIPLWRDELTIVTSLNHPLSQANTPTLKDIINYPALLPEDGTLTRKIIDNYFAAKNLSINQAPQISKPANFTVLKMLVSLGLGWSILPTLIVDETFHKVPIDIKPLHRELGILFHEQRSHSKACQTFIEVCKQHGKL